MVPESQKTQAKYIKIKSTDARIILNPHFKWAKPPLPAGSPAPPPVATAAPSIAAESCGCEHGGRHVVRKRGGRWGSFGVVGHQTIWGFPKMWHTPRSSIFNGFSIINHLFSRKPPYVVVINHCYCAVINQQTLVDKPLQHNLLWDSHSPRANIQNYVENHSFLFGKVVCKWRLFNMYAKSL